MQRGACYVGGLLVGGMVLSSLPSPAHAHLVDMRLGDFHGAALHIATGLQYALLLVALSILAALHQPETGRWMLGAAPLGVLLGAAMAVAAPGLSVPWLITVSVGLVGLLAAIGRHLPLPALIAVGTIGALVLGYENGLAITDQSDIPLFLSGLTVAALVVVCLLTAGLSRLANVTSWLRIALRAVGSWIAAASLILAALGLQATAQAG